MNNSHLGCDLIEETDDSEHMTQYEPFHGVMYLCMIVYARSQDICFCCCYGGGYGRSQWDRNCELLDLAKSISKLVYHL